MKILVTGGTGNLGKTLQEYLPNAIFISSKEYDLRSSKLVKKMYEDISPDYVIHLAARVGGILSNISDPVGYFEDNILINTNTLHYAYKYNVKGFLAVLSTCIYPDILPESYYPLVEEFLHLGPPAETNFSYGYAKRCLAVHIDSYNKQYGTEYGYVIPSNLFGNNDFSDERKDHFLTATIRKIIATERSGNKTLNIWGTGKPLRQFMDSSDLCRAIKLIVNSRIKVACNVSPDWNMSISELANLTVRVCNPALRIEYDLSKPDGQFRKDVSSERFKRLFPDFKFTNLQDSIYKTYQYAKSIL